MSDENTNQPAPANVSNVAPTTNPEAAPATAPPAPLTLLQRQKAMVSVVEKFRAITDPGDRKWVLEEMTRPE